jgi:hypothetical protein
MKQLSDDIINGIMSYGLLFSMIILPIGEYYCEYYLKRYQKRQKIKRTMKRHGYQITSDIDRFGKIEF